MLQLFAAHLILSELLSFLTASKLARSGPTSDKIVGVFRTFVQTALHYIVIIHIVFVTVETVVLTVAVTVCDCL